MKQSYIFILFMALVFMFSSCFGQNTQNADNDNYKVFINSLPSFTMYGDNYFVTGTSLDNGGFTSETSDAKFQIGFKQRLTNYDLPWDTFAFITYRQKSFWDIYKDSFPFRETNYNPSLGIAKFFVDETGIDYAFWFAFEHESNGRDEEDSRSWNFFSLEYFKPIGDWQLRAKAWLPIGNMDGNSDIASYRGYFKIGATCRAFSKIYLDLDLQPSYDEQLQGNVKVGISFRLNKKSNQYIYIQYFGGYSEDLINYNESVNNLRIGIAFKDLLANFRVSNKN